MSSGTDGMPNVLLHHVKHNKVLHKQVVLLSIVTENVPFAIGNSSLAVRELGHGFYRVLARVGFMQQPNVPKILARCEKHGLVVNAADTTYYLGRQTLLTTGKTRMAQLAQDPVLVPRAQLAPADGVLQPAAEPRRRARPADRAVGVGPGRALQARTGPTSRADEPARATRPGPRRA